MNQWIYDLCEGIEELLVESSTVKFGSAKGQRQIMNTISRLVRDTILKEQKKEEERQTIASNAIRIDKQTITRPNPERSKGFAVMTEGLSERGDENRERTAAQQKINGIQR